MEKEDILLEIRRTTEGNGGSPLGRGQFASVTGIKSKDWLGKYWARWKDALVEAGYAQGKPTYESDFLIQCYIALTRQLERFPTVDDLNVKSRESSAFPCAKTFERFGQKPQLVSTVFEYCKKHAGYGDVIAMCKSYVPQRSDHTTISDETDGYVYLLQAKNLYRIGRAGLTERREFEREIQLPGKLRTVHTIRTDDPAGVETYWLNRFASKMKAGKWFELDAADVAAFKRRRFM